MVSSDSDKLYSVVGVIHTRAGKRVEVRGPWSFTREAAVDFFVLKMKAYKEVYGLSLRESYSRVGDTYYYRPLLSEGEVLLRLLSDRGVKGYLP